jgi:hypothetical protein
MNRASQVVSTVIGTLFFTLAVTSSSFAQTASSGGDDLTSVSLSPGYAKMPPVVRGDFQPGAQSASSGLTLIFPAGATTSWGAISPTNAGGSGGVGGSNAGVNHSSGSNPNGNIPGLMTVPTFQGAFATNGTVFNYNMMGNHPMLGGRTVIPAHITAVSLVLLNADGSVNIDVPFGPFEDLTLDSPNFEEANYRSGRHTQFADAIQRAEFFNTMGEDWHTLLRPGIVDRVTLQIPRFVNVQFPDGSVKPVRSYFIGNFGKPNQFVLVLDLLFSALNFNNSVNEIINANFTTDALNISAYANTFLFSIDNQGKLANCCVLGFHNYIFDPTVTPEPRWVSAFASWTAPGIFTGGVADVTPLSHEISEAFNDPFGNNRTPVWQFPGVPANARVCQGNLETGDPVEVLPNSVVPITIRERHEVFTYHPQTEALLQWFEMGATSDAIDGAFSFPDETALPHSALPCPPAPPAK